jgi:quinol monooxygenase YgiN
MWAQLIRVRLKPGEEEGLRRVYQQLQATEQEGSGLVRSTLMRDQSDPNALYMLIVFESEEKARARERDPRREEALQEVRATMAQIYEGPPTFTDLTVVAEYTG